MDKISLDEICWRRHFPFDPPSLNLVETMKRSRWVKFIRIEERGSHVLVVLPSKPPVAGWSEGFLDEITEKVGNTNRALLVDLSSIRFVNRQIFEFLVAIIRRAEENEWRLVFAGPNRVVGPHPLMQELGKLCVITRSLEGGRDALRGEDSTKWTPGEEIYDAPLDWNGLASIAGCLIVPLLVAAGLLWLFLK